MRKDLVPWVVDRVRHPRASFGAGWMLGWYFGGLAVGGQPHALMLLGGLWLGWLATERW